MIHFEFPEDQAESVANALAGVLDTPGWYTNFDTDQDKIVIFPGRVFRELQPYPLYPLDEYFNGVTLEHKALRIINQQTNTLRPPLSRKPAPVIDLPDTKAA